ncbi:hypothetical protein M3197_09140 [Sporosarcina aquimarina]|uniref:hypothetical protein n=1 Tax=Sporosarcina aquimarina TaxID=114975 RepID=UPI00203D4CDD|nr:hypothetical protein [Sporosarcina aquimarina]MCM3757653.1 hypothetical protein [Sporosarcina aquimarina]
MLFNDLIAVEEHDHEHELIYFFEKGYVTALGESEVLSSDLNIVLENNQVAPEFGIQSLSGEKIRLSDYREKKLFFNFSLVSHVIPY